MFQKNLPDEMNWTRETRLFWTVRFIGAGLLSGILLSRKLWTSDRSYPFFPVWEWLPSFSPTVSSGLAVVFLGLVLWMVVRPGRLVISILLFAMLFLALQDQSRWQPWFYQYGLMLFPFVFVVWDSYKKVEPLRVPRRSSRAKEGPRNAEGMSTDSGIARTSRRKALPRQARLPYLNSTEGSSILGLQQFIRGCPS